MSLHQWLLCAFGSCGNERRHLVQPSGLSSSREGQAAGIRHWLGRKEVTTFQPETQR